jgi:peptidoglycan/xylan/chitin deacetylase (PgdA/CDA1 family)
MAELASAGFAAPPYDEVLGLGPSDTPRVFLTFDDGFRDVLERALPVLQGHGFHAIAFLVAARLGGSSEWQIPSGEVTGPLMDGGQVREWLAAGQAIGSHTLSHPWLTRISLAQAREEIGASKRKLEDLFGREINHFCYPYGDWTPGIRDLVHEAGYRTACTTQFGVNTPPIQALALRRVTARYPSRSWKSVRTWLQRKLAGPAN